MRGAHPTRLITLAIAAIALLLTGCTPGIMRALGYISLEEYDALSAELDAANLTLNEKEAAISSLQGEIQTLQSDNQALVANVAALESDVSALEAAEIDYLNQITGLESLSDNWMGLLCEESFDYTYNDIAVAADNNNGDYASLWDFRLYYTQWLPSGSSMVDGLDWWSLITVYEFGEPIFIVNTREGCMMINTDWIDVGQEP